MWTSCINKFWSTARQPDLQNGTCRETTAGSLSFISPKPRPSKEELVAAHKKPVTRIPETGCGFRRKLLPYPADHTCRQHHPVPLSKPPSQPANESPVCRKTAITPFSPVDILMHRTSKTPELEVKQAERRNTQAQHAELWVLCDTSGWLNAVEYRTHVTAAYALCLRAII
ncbi:unnamed protein product, partial [Ixodes hexagonus]